MDKRKSKLNIAVSITFKIIQTFMVILVRRALIQTCGNAVNGLNALYLSILGFLAVAELGVGAAITFCMYKPIVDGDHVKVSALYHLFTRVYTIIGGVILACGLLLLPFLHLLAKDYAQLDVNLYSSFAMILLSVVITYLFGAKLSLINAYKNNYISTAISYGSLTLQQVLQIAVLYLTRSFTWYLACRIFTALLQWAITELVTRKKYGHILSLRTKVDPHTRGELMRNIKAMFMHKIGGLLVNTMDSLVISVFIGVAVLGEYTNYAEILNAVSNLLALFFISLTSIFGHLYAQKSKAVTQRYFELFHFANFALGIVFFLGYYAVIDDVIAVLFSEDLLVSKSISMTVAINGFVQFMRRSTLTFRDATGTFYHDRWKPLAEGLVNVVMSVLLVKTIGVAGVIAATIVTNLVICHIVEPYVLYKYAFETSPKRFYLRNYAMILAFMASLGLFVLCQQDYVLRWQHFLVNGFLAVGIALAMCAVMLLFSRPLRQLLKSFLHR